MKTRIVVLLGLAALLIAIGPASAQSFAAGNAPRFGPAMPAPVHPATYGGNVTSVISIPASQFTPFDTGVAYNDLRSGGMFVSRYPTGPGNGLVAAVSGPGGALLTLIELDYCDTNTSGHHMQLGVLDCDWTGSNCAEVVPPILSLSNGCNWFILDVTAENYQIDNWNHRLYLVANTDAFDGTNAISGVLLGYKLQVSQPPGTASFVDVPTTSPIFKFVEALKASGITAGCDTTHYCPNAPLTRGQMAVFLAAGLGLEFP